MSKSHLSEEPSQSSGKSSLSERLLGLLGAVAVLAISGFMFWQGLRSEQSAPDVQVEIIRIEPNHDDYLVEILAVNYGDSTAAAATVKGELVRTGKPTESSSVTIDYVPPHSRVQAGLYFEEPPTRETLKLSVDGYHKP